MDPYIGQIILFTGNFAPRGFLACDGQLLPISQHTALFSVLGTMYGGDGVSTFALPDLRGRAPLDAGQGQGLSPRRLGMSLGVERVTLTEAQLPSHSHAVNCQAGQGSLGTPAGNFLAGDRTGADDLYASSSDSRMNHDVVSVTGGHVPHNNMPPSLALNFVIAIHGSAPSRSFEEGVEACDIPAADAARDGEATG